MKMALKIIGGVIAGLVLAALALSVYLWFHPPFMH